MAKFYGFITDNCGDNHFQNQVTFTCMTCGHKWFAQSGAVCPKCNGNRLSISSVAETEPKKVIVNDK